MENVNELYNDMKSWFENYKRAVAEQLNNQYRVFTAEEVCAIMGISDKTLRTWNKMGFPHSQINRTIRYTWEDIKSFLAQKKVNKQ